MNNKKLKILLLIIIAILTILVTFMLLLGLNFNSMYRLIFYEKYKNTFTIDCEESGGRVRYSPYPGVRGPLNCYFPPSDEGELCYEDSDCVKQCVSTNKTDDDGYFIGKCGEYSAINCIPTIPNKTKDRNKLHSGSCV